MMGTGIQVLFHPVNPDTAYALHLNQQGVWKTVDGGATDWVAVNNGLTSLMAYQGTVNPSAPNELCITCFGAGVFKTVDGGANWVAKNTGLTSLPSAITRRPQDPNVLYAGASDGFIFKSVDNAENWVCLNPDSASKLPFSIYGILLDPKDTNLVYCGGSGINTFWKSADGGVTWQLKNTGIEGYNGFTGYMAIDPVNTNNLYVSGYAGAVHRSTDYGETWSFAGKGLRVQAEVVVVDHSDPNILYAGGGIYHGGCGVWKSIDKGLTWSRINTGFPENIKYPFVKSMVMDPANNNVLYAGGYPMSRKPTPIGIYKTIDGGANWAAKNNGLTDTIIRAMVISRVAPNILYTSTRAGLFKTVDGGENWALALNDTMAFSLAVDPVDSNTVYVGTISSTTTSFYKTVDGGANWTPITFPDTIIISIAVSPSNPSIIYAGTESGKIFKSSDAGQNWQEKSNGLPQLHDLPFWRYPRMYCKDDPQGVNSIVIHPSTSNAVYAALCYDSGSVYQTVDGGDSWVKVNNGYHGYSPQVLVLDTADSNTLYAGSYAGVWAYTLGPVGIFDNNGFQSKLFKKAIAYFNPGKGNLITFKYELHSDAEVTVKIYNLLNRCVASVTENKKAGRQATQLGISGIPAGLYLYQITAKDNVTCKIEKWQVQKQVIIR